MKIQEVAKKIFDYSFSRESLLKFLSENTCTIEELFEYTENNKTFIEEDFRKFLKEKRKQQNKIIN